MVLEQGVLSGQYNPQNPLPSGSNRAEIYNGMLPHLKALMDGLGRIGQSHSAIAADIAITWAIAKGAIPIIGVTKPGHISGLLRATKLTLSDNEIAELEALANTAGVNTRGWWEKEM